MLSRCHAGRPARTSEGRDQGSATHGGSRCDLGRCRWSCGLASSVLRAGDISTPTAADCTATRAPPPAHASFGMPTVGSLAVARLPDHNPLSPAIPPCLRLIGSFAGHPASTGAFVRVHNERLPARHRCRGDHRHDPRAASADDARQRRSRILTPAPTRARQASGSAP
jgi:hypothetical protein